MAIIFIFLAIFLPSTKAIGFKDAFSNEIFEIEVYQPRTVLSFKFVEEKIGYIPSQGKVAITWSISGNPLISHFEVERADDKSLTFKNLGKLPLENWDEEMANYRFEDNMLPKAGGRIYYRIKQIDSNGYFQYGRTLSVEVVPSFRKDNEVWRSFPNPVKNGNFQVILLDNSKYNGEEISVRVIQSGNVLMSSNCTDLKELNDFLANSLHNISSGLLLVELRWGYQTQFLKLWHLR